MTPLAIITMAPMAREVGEKGVLPFVFNLCHLLVSHHSTLLAVNTWGNYQELGMQ